MTYRKFYSLSWLCVSGEEHNTLSSYSEKLQIVKIAVVKLLSTALKCEMFSDPV